MNLARFAFRLVDTDHSGSLSTDEVQNVVEIIYGDTVADYKNNVYKPALFKPTNPHIVDIYQSLLEEIYGYLCHSDMLESYLYNNYHHDLSEINSIMRCGTSSYLLNKNKKKKDFKKIVHSDAPNLEAPDPRWAGELSKLKDLLANQKTPA